MAILISNNEGAPVRQGAPFNTIEEALSFLVKKAEIEFDVTEDDINHFRIKIKEAITTGEKFAGYYFKHS